MDQFIELRLGASQPTLGQGLGALVSGIVARGDDLADLDRVAFVLLQCGRRAFTVECEIHLADFNFAIQCAVRRFGGEALHDQPTDTGQYGKHAKGNGQTLHSAEASWDWDELISDHATPVTARDCTPDRVAI
jgi:hypothetical protein